jgi:hypothetical protein
LVVTGGQQWGVVFCHGQFFCHIRSNEHSTTVSQKCSTDVVWAFCSTCCWAFSSDRPSTCGRIELAWPDRSTSFISCKMRIYFR